MHLECHLSARNRLAIRYALLGANALLSTILLVRLVPPSKPVCSRCPVVPSPLFFERLAMLLALLDPLEHSGPRAILPDAAFHFPPAPPAGPGRAAQCRPFQHLGDLERVMVLRRTQIIAHSTT